MENLNKLPTLRDELVALLGNEAVLDDPMTLDARSGDWSEAEKCRPALVLLPSTPQEVAGAMRLCAKHSQPIVVQGGLTGLAGGATPQEGDIALSLARMNSVEDIDAVGGTALVQAGVVLEELQRQVELEGWSFPLDLGARGSCQVGGNAATNAGGNRVIRYGTMRELVLGLEVVLPDGRILSMLNRTTKNTTGFELKHLFIGSEGALGIVTRLVLKLSPLATSTATALCALPSFDAAAHLLRDLRRELPSLAAFELMWADFLEAGSKVTGLRPPFPQRYPLYALVETLGGEADADGEQLQRVLAHALETGTADDVIVATSMDHAARLWAYRESIGELLSHTKPHAAFDVGIPMARMAEFVAEVRIELEKRFPEQHHLFFGHLGDGNLHVLSGPFTSDADLHEVERMVYAAVGAAGGSVSAEHGIGSVKRDYLHLSRSPEEIDVMRGLKGLFDPGGLLNRGKLLS